MTDENKIQQNAQRFLHTCRVRGSNKTVQIRRVGAEVVDYALRERGPGS